MRQFGGVQPTDIQPIPPTFQRVDGRGKPDVDWVEFHQTSITIWDHRREHTTEITQSRGDGSNELKTYLRWYKSWASVFLLKAPTTAPETYYPHSPGERLMAEFCVRSAQLAEPYFGGAGENASGMQLAMDEISQLAGELRRSVHIDAYDDPEWREEDTELIFRRRRSTAASSVRQSRRRSTSDMPRGQGSGPTGHSDTRPSSSQAARPAPSPVSSHPWSAFSMPWSIPEVGPSQMPAPMPYMPMPYPSPMMTPSSGGMPPFYPAPYWVQSPISPGQSFMMYPPTGTSSMGQQGGEQEESGDHEEPGDRARQAPDRYTPGSDAIPRRRRRH